jgi:alpha-ketoglutaric semialdehyde dehydrogenase
MYETVNAAKANIKADNNVDEIMQQAFDAFNLYRKISPRKRAAFLKAIADGTEKERAVLVQIANEETNLPAARLNGELTRTVAGGVEE